MNYIILDMEWDGTYHHKYKRFINQILQIGAVKLDENFNIIDTFDETIKSSFSKRVSGRFTQLTGITKEMMLAGISIDEAVSRYNSWIGDDTVTMTWSNSDLFTIIENEKYVLNGGKFKIDKYLDLQKYIQGELQILGHECKSQISLGNAAEVLGVTTENYDLHTAKDDSLLSAAILKKHYNAERFSALVRDTANPEFYNRLFYKPYYISDINNENVDKSHFQFKCGVCGVELKRNTKWRFKNRNFTAECSCPKCKKRFICRVSFKKTFDSVIVKRHISDFKVKVKTEEQKDAVPIVPERL